MKGLALGGLTAVGLVLGTLVFYGLRAEPDWPLVERICYDQVTAALLTGWAVGRYFEGKWRIK